MRHRKGRNRLNRVSSHAEAMLANLVTSLFKYERVTTTLKNAKESSKLAEKIITEAKSGSLYARRKVLKTIKDKEIVKKLFNDLGPRYKAKPGGYTRIFKVANSRKGDGAGLAMLDLVDGVVEQKLKEEVAKKKTPGKKKNKGDEKKSVVKKIKDNKKDKLEKKPAKEEPKKKKEKAKKLAEPDKKKDTKKGKN